MLACRMKVSMKKLSLRIEVIIGGLLAIALVFVLTFKLGAVPAGLHVDEAGMAYDALALAEQGTDRFGYHNPVYLINFGGGQNALYTYLASLVVRIFGFSVVAIRIPAVAMALLAAVAFYFLLRKAKGARTALTGLALLTVLPFSIMHARWGLESYLFFPMAMMALAALWLALKERKIWQFILAGAVCGLTLYTYAVSYVILPMFLAVVIIYALVTKRMNFWELVAFAVPLGLLALPLMLMLAVNQGWLGEIVTDFFSVPKMWFYRGGEFSLSNVANNLNIFEIIFSHDFLDYNGNAWFGTMYYVSVPLVVLGLVLTVRRTYRWVREDWSAKTKPVSTGFLLDAMMLVFFVANFICAMIVSQPNINKINAIYVPLIYFLVVGIMWLDRRWRFSLAVIGAIYLVAFGLFAKWYYFDYSAISASSDLSIRFEDFQEALAFAKTKTDGEINVRVSVQPYIYVMLAEEIPAREFREKAVIDGLDVVEVGRYSFGTKGVKVNPDGVYVCLGKQSAEDEAVLEKMAQREFGQIVVYYAKE